MYHWKFSFQTPHKLMIIWPHMFQSWHSPKLQTFIANIHTSAGCFLGPSCASWVGVSDQTAVSNAVCRGWLKVSASVSHGRWLTLSLSSLSFSALASLSFFSISTRSKRHGLWEEEELCSPINRNNCKGDDTNHPGMCRSVLNHQKQKWGAELQLNCLFTELECRPAPAIQTCHWESVQNYNFNTLRAFALTK